MITNEEHGRRGCVLGAVVQAGIVTVRGIWLQRTTQEEAGCEAGLKGQVRNGVHAVAVMLL